MILRSWGVFKPQAHWIKLRPSVMMIGLLLRFSILTENSSIRRKNRRRCWGLCSGLETFRTENHRRVWRWERKLMSLLSLPSFHRAHWSWAVYCLISLRKQLLLDIPAAGNKSFSMLNLLSELWMMLYEGPRLLWGFFTAIYTRQISRSYINMAWSPLTVIFHLISRWIN